MKVIKTAEFKDDSFYFIIEKDDKLKPVVGDNYYEIKRTAFIHRVIDKSEFPKEFYDRPSFTDIIRQDDLSGTIYTYSAEKKNKMKLSLMKQMIAENKHKSRRCVIVMADSLKDYLDNSVNTSCLNIIHYLEDSVKLFFRASDMTNELLYDIHLIYEFFISEVYESAPEIHVIASTAQNIIDPSELLEIK